MGLPHRIKRRGTPPALQPLTFLLGLISMELEKTKAQIKYEIEQGRRLFYATGRRVRYLAPGDQGRVQNAKPRKQRLKMFS